MEQGSTEEADKTNVPSGEENAKNPSRNGTSNFNGTSNSNGAGELAAVEPAPATSRNTTTASDTRKPSSTPFKPPAVLPDEPGATATTMSVVQAAAVWDEKASYRREAAAAPQPGAVSVTAAKTRAPGAKAVPGTGPPKGATMGDEKATFRVPEPVSRPGATDVTPSAAAAAATTTILSAAEPSSTVMSSNRTKPVSYKDEKAKERFASPASRPGVVAVTPGAKQVAGAVAVTGQDTAFSMEDQHAVIQTAESDLLAKKKASKTGTTQPGAVAASPSSSSSGNRAIAAKMNSDLSSAVVQGDEMDRQTKQKERERAATATAAGTAAGNNMTTVQHGATAMTTPDRSIAAKMDSRLSSAVVRGDEEDRLVKQKEQQRSDDAKKGAATSIAAKTKTAVVAAAATTVSVEAALDDDKAIPPTSGSRAVGSGGLEDVVDVEDPSKKEVEKSSEFLLSSRAFGIAGDNEGGNGEKDLAVAVAIDEERELSKLVSAEDFEERHRAVNHSPWFLALLTLFVCIGIGGIITGIVVGIRDDDDPQNPTLPPTAAPTLAPPTMAEESLHAFLDAQNISQATLDSAPDAYLLAVNWYANVDKTRNRTLDVTNYPWDYERFILIWFYYITSSNGTKPWVSCNPPDYEAGQNDTCTFMKYREASTNDNYVNFTQEPGRQRWLSNSHHCEWPGVFCYTDAWYPDGCQGAIQYFFMPAFGLNGPFPAVTNQLPCFDGVEYAWNSEFTGIIPEEFFNARPGTYAETGMFSF